MVRLAYDYPTVESTELLATYARTSPRFYSCVATADKYLLRYASNTWNVQFPDCTFHPPTNTVRIPLPFVGHDGGPAQHLDVPYQGLASLSFTQTPDPYTNSITLGALCEVYFLAESVIVRLPGTAALAGLYPQLPQDGLSFSLSYTDIFEHRIRDNLTKLALSVQSEHQSHRLVLYPLQRFPPQPLVAGVFQRYADLTPLQALQVVDDAIVQGTDLARQMVEYARTAAAMGGPFDRSSSAASSGVTSMSGGGAPESTDTEMLLCQTGQGDDDTYDDFDYAEDSVGMHVEMVGGFNSSGVKRARRESDDVVPVNGPSSVGIAKHKRLYSPSI